MTITTFRTEIMVQSSLDRFFQNTNANIRVELRICMVGAANPGIPGLSCVRFGDPTAHDIMDQSGCIRFRK